MRDGLYQVTRGNVCAGFVVEAGRVTATAPILRARGYAGHVRRVDTFHRLLVTGSRDWWDVAVVHQALEAVLRKWQRLYGCQPDQIVVVHGMAKGADTIARRVALQLGMRVEDHPVKDWEWKRYGNAAGHRRNARMVAHGALGCVAFPLGISKGTRGCMSLCGKAGIEVWNRGDRSVGVAA